MKTLGGGSVALGAALTLFALTASPAFASGTHGGGSGGGGGGGHAYSGGHSSGGGGGHAFSGGHFSGSRFSGSHLAAPVAMAHGGYSATRNGAGYGYSRASPSVGRTVAGGYGRAGAGYAASGRGGYGANGRGGYGANGRGGYGYGHGGGYGGRWGGGYWHGGYWPPIFWGAGFAWFLPILPAYCAAYWWNSVPYYYYNDVYYTYDPAASGYVVTTPPPAADYDAAASDSEGAGPGAAAPWRAPGASGVPANGDGLYAYPKNGQSDAQQAADRSECAQWAGSQTGSDGAGASLDYRRALSACLQGRGYSVN